MHQRHRATYLQGEARLAARAKAKQLYEQGCTVRSVAERMGRSYGGTHKLLVEAQVVFRARTGGVRKAGA